MHGNLRYTISKEINHSQKKGTVEKTKKNGNTIIHVTTIADPPALLTAVAERARAGKLKGTKIHSFNPQEQAYKSILHLTSLTAPKATLDLQARLKDLKALWT